MNLLCTGVCTFVFTFCPGFVSKLTCVYTGIEGESEPYFSLYITCIGGYESGEACWLRARSCLGAQKYKSFLGYID